MKLKHIFETAQRLQITKRQVVQALDEYFYGIHPALAADRVRIDEKGIHVDNILTGKDNMRRMPLQLASVSSITTIGVETLENFPQHVESTLMLTRATVDDLSTAPPITFGGSSLPVRLIFHGCDNLSSLEGLEKFTVIDSQKLEVEIKNCASIAFDPYDYADRYLIWFVGSVPKHVKLVKSIALTDHTGVKITGITDKQLQAIINKWRGAGPAALIPLARELIAAGYEHHVRST